MEETKGRGSAFIGFYELLQEHVSGYDGKYHEIVGLTPDIFKLFVNFLEDPMVKASSKPLINATIAYFVAPFDAIPEEIYGPVGYLDDLFLASWVLRKLEEEVGYAVLVNNWEGDRELSEVVDEIYEKTRGVIKDLEADILDYAGLQ